MGSDPIAQGFCVLSALFEIDPRLKADTIFVADLQLCALLIMNDARYPWAILVPRVDSAREIFELNHANYATVWEEIRAVADAISQLSGVTKVNIGALGNIVSQLHIHIVGRHESDPAWPGPVWGHSPRVPFGKGEEDYFAQYLQQCLSERIEK